MARHRRAFARALTIWLGLGLATPVQAQSFDLGSLGLGLAFPFVLELDGNPNTTEWGLNTLAYGLWVVNPATGCKSQIPLMPPAAASADHRGFFFTIARIAGKDHLMVMSLDLSSNGAQPLEIRPIETPCYQAK
jgi:hypothetical protein